MLGTLVALAVARMRNLETFIWDMPTGVLRDVWLALSSLSERDDGEDCRLERVWVRWHDNAQLDMMNAVPPPTLPQNNIAPPNGIHTSGNATAQTNFVVQASQFLGVAQAMERVEHPSFSVLPSLKSLSVLEIDELRCSVPKPTERASGWNRVSSRRYGLGASVGRRLTPAGRLYHKLHVRLKDQQQPSGRRFRHLGRQTLQHAEQCANRKVLPNLASRRRYQTVEAVHDQHRWLGAILVRIRVSCECFDRTIISRCGIEFL